MPAEPPVLVRIARDTIERGDVEKVTSFLDGLLPDKIESHRNRIVFHVDGYGNDEKELYEIGDVRAFFGKFFAACPGAFHWLEASDQGLLFLALMNCTPVQDGTEARISGEDMEVFLSDGLQRLSTFSAEIGTDPEPSVRAVSGLIRKKIGQ